MWESQNVWLVATSDTCEYNFKELKEKYLTECAHPFYIHNTNNSPKTTFALYRVSAFFCMPHCVFGGGEWQIGVSFLSFIFQKILIS